MTPDTFSGFRAAFAFETHLWRRKSESYLEKYHVSFKPSSFLRRVALGGFFLSPVLASDLVGQVTWTGTILQQTRAKTAMGVASDTKTLAANLPIAPSVTAAAATAGNAANLTASVSAEQASVSASMKAQGALLAPGYGKGSGVVRFVLSATRDTPGHVFVEITSATSSTLWEVANSAVSAKIGNSTLRWTSKESGLRRGFYVIAARTPIAIDVAFSSEANSVLLPASAKLSVRLSFEPAKFGTYHYGSSCAQLNAAFQVLSQSQARLTLTVNSGVSNGAGISFFGTRKLNLATRFPGCYLLVEPLLAAGIFTTDSSGRAVHTPVSIELGLRSVGSGCCLDRGVRHHAVHQRRRPDQPEDVGSPRHRSIGSIVDAH